MIDNTLEGWLPIDFGMNRTRVVVKWMQFGSRLLSEPFFNWTVERMRSLVPPAGERETGLKALLTKTARLEPVSPAGIIFHVSRCGSTLLSNAFRLAEATVVLSEARPVGAFFQPDIFKRSPFPVNEWDSARRMLLDSIVTLYAHSENRNAPHHVIKCNASNMLHMALIRSVWPDAPCIVLIRDPVEVIMSILAKGAGWVRFRSETSLAWKVFGWAASDVEAMPMEEYCARVVGRFCESAIPMIDDTCRVLDYENITASRILEIADFFGLKLPPADSEEFVKVMTTYSKDSEGAKPFEDDCERKQLAASEAVRESAAQWAQSPYEALKRLEQWRPSCDLEDAGAGCEHTSGAAMAG